MRFRRLGLSAILLALAIGACLAIRLTARRPYKVLDLGMPEGSSSQAFAVNDQGQVVGWTLESQGNGRPGIARAFLWENGRTTLLGEPGLESQALAINNQGQVVGCRMNWKERAFQACLWEQGKRTDLGTLGGKGSCAWGINDHGQVVGTAQIADGESHAFLWEQGKMTDLGALPGGSSIAYAINDQGLIVGSSKSSPSSSRAVLWDRVGIRDLGTLGGLNSRALAVNSRGEIVGWAEDEQGVQHACRFSLRSGEPQRLTVSLHGESQAFHINDRGEIVGHTWTHTPGSFTAARFDGSAVPLHRQTVYRPGFELLLARGINASGWIVGYSRRVRDNAERAFLLVPRR